MRRRANSLWLVPTVVAAIVAAWGDVSAQPAPSGKRPEASPNPAQVLFDRGVAEMEAGSFEKGCPAIEASQRLEPMPGTLFTLAECEAQRGRTATAMRHYAEYLALYRAFTAAKKLSQKDRAVASESQLQKLALLTPRLTLELPAESAEDVVVELDGEVVAALSLGTAIPIDPGDHVVTTQVPGGPAIEHRVSLSAGVSRKLVLRVELEGEPPASANPAGTSARPVPSAPTLPPPDVRPWRIGALSAGAVAVVGIGIGIVTGVLAFEQRGVLLAACGGDSNCDPSARPLLDRLRALGTASTVGFVAGGVGLGVGVTLLLATPTAPTPAPSVGSAPSMSVASPGAIVSFSGSF